MAKNESVFMKHLQATQHDAPNVVNLQKMLKKIHEKI